ncbi:MAG: hypothetical protein PHH08_02165 [Candidatus ainarchaeum sp.]|nr:hypothetical protein [Candidatus ainarchaeum sp.]
MALSSFVYSARKHTPEAQKFDPAKKLANFIDATKPLTGDERAMLGKDAEGTAVDANGVPVQAAPVQRFNWETCEHMKKASPNCLCRRFFSICVKEKCKGRFNPSP